MPSTVRDKISADLARRISHSSYPSPFETRSLAALESWSGPIPKRVRAKVLMSLIAAEPTPAVVEALADAIGALDDWNVVLAEFLRNAHVTPAVVFAAARIAQARGLDVPWAAMTEPPSYANAVYEALEDGNVIRFKRQGSHPKAGPCFVIGIEKPLVQYGTGDLAFDGDACILSGIDDAWIEPGRLVCPAFAVVVR